MADSETLASNDQTLDALAGEAIDLVRQMELTRSQSAAIGVVRNFDGTSRDQSGRLMQRLKAAEVSYIDVPLALPATLREYELQAGPELVGLIDATATYPLLAAQFASLRRLPILTVLHAPSQEETSLISGPPAIALFSAGQPIDDSDGHASARVIRLHNIATRSVVVLPAIHQHSAIELISSDLFTFAADKPPSRKVYDDASFTITASNSGLILTHSSPGFGKRTWAVEEVTLADLGRSHTIRLDSADPVKTKGSMTLRKIGADSCDCEHTQH